MKLAAEKIYFDHRDIRRPFSVFTNGVYDLLHVGHLALLERAAQLKITGNSEDALIVAVNQDDSVNRLKGDSRPINSCMDRMRLLAGFSCVDIVTPFTGDNVAQVIRDLMPRFWVKGAPYTRETLNKEEVAAADAVCCKIVILEKLGDYSTTEIVRRLKG